MSKDNVNHPNHYNQGGVECIEAIKSACSGLDGIEAFCTGNALKIFGAGVIKMEVKI